MNNRGLHSSIDDGLTYLITCKNMNTSALYNMENNENKLQYICKNCKTEFTGNFCPECGQSKKEFERPFWFLIIDLTGNIFAFDTRVWKTLIAILFKPGKLTLDYVKGHRVRYMPPFRFYVFISFIFFLMLNYQSSQKFSKSAEKMKGILSFNYVTRTDDLSKDLGQSENEELNTEPAKTSGAALTKEYFKKHPELFFKQLLTNLSWAMFILMPFYAFLLWLFFHKSQQYYITHLILAINQHSFMFIVLFIVLLLAVVFPVFSASFRDYLILLIPVYFTIGYINLYRQKIWKSLLKLFAIGIIYSIVVGIVTIGLIILVVVQNGMFKQ